MKPSLFLIYVIYVICGCNLRIGFKFMKQARISEVRAFVIAPGESGVDYHNQQGSHWIIDLPIATTDNAQYGNGFGAL